MANFDAALNRWLQQATEDPDLIRELKALKAEGDEKGIEDRFYKSLAFGTGGLRGVIGAGTNRINLYTVRQATQGLAAYLLESGKTRKVAIAHDSRNKSVLFARTAAAVLAANGIEAWLYPRLMPTPALSFAVRHLGCGAGICVTASHNPAKYNGYKVYGEDGGQITTEAAARIQAYIAEADPFEGVKTMDYCEGLATGGLRRVPETVVDAFLAAVAAQQVCPATDVPLKVVYSPLNGAGLECVTRILGMTGVEDIVVVPQQELPDGNFPTCPFPNPEIRAAMQLGLDLSARVKPDLLLATDPDCDRVGIAVEKEGAYVLLSGNEVGCLLLDYICRARREAGTLPERPVAVKTIVTTDMARPIAQKYGVELREVLTGFKFIGEQIGILEENGEENRYIFGFEESYGYLSGGYVRDKDAVDASMLICEMARYYKRRGQTLAQALAALYEEHGHYTASLLDYAYEGKDGMRQMEALMQALRSAPPVEMAGFAVEGGYDYLNKTAFGAMQPPQLALPASNVLEYRMPGETKLIVRPSGTEPKIKIYLHAKGATESDVAEKIKRLSAYAANFFGGAGEQ